jgi:16S rRNA (guanine527-N7)-methyltransferase
VTEQDAHAWIAQRFDDTVHGKLRTFVELIVEENKRQNLISPATIPHVWTRHVVDSLQLIELTGAGTWVDVGTGGGFPGLVVAIARPGQTMLVEPRKRRAEFLRSCIEALALEHVTVAASKIEQVNVQAAVISARAVASMEKLLRAARHCATPATQWLLPRGTIDTLELEAIAREFGMMFHVKQSVTQTSSFIVVLKPR